MGKKRIAIASTDGKVVNQHFGRAEEFYIVDVDEEKKPHFVERRGVCPVCDGGNHNETQLKENVKKLEDCDCVLVSRIGPGAAGMLEQHGINAYEIPGLIEESVKKLLAYIEITLIVGSTNERDVVSRKEIN